MTEPLDEIALKVAEIIVRLETAIAASRAFEEYMRGFIQGANERMAGLARRVEALEQAREHMLTRFKQWKSEE